MKEREEKKQQRDPAVDFLRVIACLMVVGIHVNAMGTGSRWRRISGTSLTTFSCFWHIRCFDRFTRIGRKKRSGGASALPQRRLCGVQRMQMQPIPIVGTVFI